MPPASKNARQLPRKIRGHAGHPHTGHKRPRGDTQPPRFPVGPVAPARDNLIDDGAMPVTLLHARTDEWIAREKAAG